MKLFKFMYVVLFLLILNTYLKPEIYSKILKRDGRFLQVDKGEKDGIRLSMNAYVIAKSSYKGYNFNYISARGLLMRINKKTSLVMIDKRYKDFNLKELTSVVFNKFDFKDIVVDRKKVIKTINKMEKIRKAVDDFIRDYGIAPPVSGSVLKLKEFKMRRNNNEIDVKFIPFYITDISEKDEWNNEIIYKHDNINESRFQIVSPGKDGTLGTKDDIVLGNSLELNSYSFEKSEKSINLNEEDDSTSEQISIKEKNKISYFFNGENYISEKFLLNLGESLIKLFHPLSLHRKTVLVDKFYNSSGNIVIKLRTEYRSFEEGNIMEYGIMFNKFFPICFS